MTDLVWGRRSLRLLDSRGGCPHMFIVAAGTALRLQRYLHIQIAGYEGPGVGCFVYQLCD
jgi:hypothetical protein